MIRRRRKARAFTLLEMLVALAMTAVLAGSLYATLHAAFRARGTASSAVETPRKVALALELLRADIQSAVVPRGLLAGSFLGENGTDALGRESDSLLLHCTAPASQQAGPTGDVMRIELTCEPAADGSGGVLVRSITRNLLAPVVEDPAQEVLCRGVYAFGLRYFDGIDWQDDWDSGARDNVLPSAVAVTLQLQDDQSSETDGAGYGTTRVFLVPCSSIEPGVGQPY